MDIKGMETLIRNIDARTRRMEQILPTLVTKAELSQLRDEMQTLATKAELGQLRDEMQTLATKAELRQLRDEMQTLATKAELREQGDRIILRTEVLIESLRDDIRLIAENQTMLHQRIDKLESRG